MKRNTAKASKCGRMGRSTKGIGLQTKPVDMADLSTLMVTSTAETGATTRVTATESTLIRTGQSTKGNGKTICNMVKVRLINLSRTAKKPFLYTFLS